MFEADDREFPRNLSEMSLDYILFFVLLGCTFVLFAVGDWLSIPATIGALVTIGAVLSIISLRHRIRSNWNWPGVGVAGGLKAILSATLGIFFFGAVAISFPPTSPTMISFFAFGGAFVLFPTLYHLNIVTASKAIFESRCGVRPTGLPEPRPLSTEPSWKRAVRRGYSISFLAVAVTFTASIWIHSSSHRNGTPERTPERTVAHTVAGETRYITAREERLMVTLRNAAMIGIPALIGAGAILHFLVGVKLFPNTPTLAELVGKADN